MTRGCGWWSFGVEHDNHRMDSTHMESRARLLARLAGVRQLLRDAAGAPVLGSRAALRGTHYDPPRPRRLDGPRALRAGAAPAAASCPKAHGLLRQLDERPVPRVAHQRGNCGGVRCDGGNPPAHLSDSHQATETHARVVRVAG